MRSKRYQEQVKKIDKTKTYSFDEAIKLIKETATVKFDASVEVHTKLGINPKQGDQLVRGTVTLPHGTGKTKRVVVFTETKTEEARKAGADMVGGKDLISEIKISGKTDFDIAIADPSMMKDLAVIARVLGPRGLMPSPKNETVTDQIGKAVEAMKGGKVSFKNDDTANIHQVIGKVSWTEDVLKENLSIFLDALKRAKPSSSKGVYMEKVYLATTMGPSIRITV